VVVNNAGYGLFRAAEEFTDGQTEAHLTTNLTGSIRVARAALPFLRAQGGADTPAWAVARTATLAEWRGWSPIAAIQVEYNLLERTSEGELFGAARSWGWV
jgi:NAD(P)-dependent dehydrogenase (short-subunit alcohol dehydrogenase family)